MTLSAAIALFSAMVVLAALPGPGQIVVMARSISGGFKEGVITSLGVVAGDYVFILLSILGLSTLAANMGETFVWIQTLGAGYLIWLGLSLLRAQSLEPQHARSAPGQLVARYGVGFIAGLLTTLSNPKAILFYLSFFPAFLDLNGLLLTDVFLVLLITLMAVGGTMMAFAFLAVQARQTFVREKWRKGFHYLSALMLIGSAFVLILSQ